MIKWLYDHYILSGLLSGYYMALIGYGTVQVFSNLSIVSPSVSAVYATLMALPAAAVSLIKWRLGKDNADKVSDE